ncbi:uncharacterized protein CELE_C46G7.2 [Caenorhabditis elegans]|uniref:Uncharacterized protein n=1 Tax=Caenorhabditis elegans TaxID=6239 RepID=O02141_CAEEL|nr:Uncharacterized protein CELE_C46G7.2 [Caenorhabditis elegans]CCD67201.1 Uncharacterized protein CELE_C46G7.2 [Caenorhabditis elegans]|eukprot:NP_500904.1 Uncharacterized protein CELE_C46G7.2 [Caenorhabditis elegans]
MSTIAAGRFAKDDVDQDTKWWKEYPSKHYIERARPQNYYDEFVQNAWSKSKRLARAASFTNLTYIKDKDMDFPIRKSDSVSTLAPSLALPQYCREAQRIVHTVPVYKPTVHDWYNKSYSDARWRDTHREINKPYKPLDTYISPASSHVPYYSFQTKRIFFDEKARQLAPYLKESQRYMDRYVSSRLKADDYANRFAYTAYEWRKPQDHSFNREFMTTQGVFVATPTGIPHQHYDKFGMRRLYKRTGRFFF